MYILEKTTKMIRLCILELIGLSDIKLYKSKTFRSLVKEKN